VAERKQNRFAERHFDGPSAVAHDRVVARVTGTRDCTVVLTAQFSAAGCSDRVINLIVLLHRVQYVVIIVIVLFFVLCCCIELRNKVEYIKMSKT